MAIYAVGDVQGCYVSLLQLLDVIDFNPHQDRLWFAGDLVNRGPDSLSVLRFVQDLGDAAVCVLGNHDLHMLAVAHGGQKFQRKDNFDDVLNAPDRSKRLDWLRRQPLIHHDAALGYVLTHAGLYPAWSVTEALALAAEVEAILRGPDYVEFLAAMYGDRPDRWSPDLRGLDRQRFIVNCFTRMRYLDAEDRLDMKHKGPPGSQPDDLIPWYASPNRVERDATILFGHWSTHGAGEVDNTIPLDTGCLWGGRLTAVRLDGERRFYQVECPGARKPGAD